MFGASKLVALILAFTLGFSCAGGILIGGVAIALGSFRVRDLEKYEIMEIPDELFMEENPKTDLLNLTAFEMLDEMKRLYKMGDGVTINYLQSEYGIKLPSASQKFLTDEAREMPLKSLFSEAGVISLLATVYIGYLQSFECHALDSTEPADPALGKDGARWFNPSNGEYLTGIDETLAFISLGSVVEGKLSVQGLLDDIVIGDVMGYQQDENGDWYKVDEDDNPEYADGLIGSFIGCTITDVPEKFNDLKVGDALGYHLGEDGEWYTSDDVPVTDMTAFLADSPIKDIGKTLQDATIGELLGYKQDENGDWYKIGDDGNPEYATGVMAILVDCDMDGAGDAINTAKIGTLMGYQEKDDVWYDADGEPVSGFMSKIADSSLVADEEGEGGVGDVLDSLTIADMISEEDQNDGIFAILPSNTPITGIAGEINRSISESPLQFFINEELITFDDTTQTSLDTLCTKYVPYDENDEKFIKYYKDHGNWVKAGNEYLIPEWRTQPLSDSFNYIINMIIPS